MAILVTQLPECFGISRRIKGAGEVQLQLELVACGKDRNRGGEGSMGGCTVHCAAKIKQAAASAATHDTQHIL